MVQRPDTQTHRPWATTAGFGLMCLLLSVGAMRADLFPGSPARTTPQLERDALPLALLALVAGLFALMRGERWPRGRQLVGPIAVGLGLFAAPDVLVHFAQGWVSAFTRVVLFSLTLVLTVVLEPHIGQRIGPGSRSQSGASLLAALVSVAGVLCIFPIDLPGSLEGGVAIAVVIAAIVCVAVTNCFAVRFASSLSSTALAPMAAIAGGAAALGLLAASLFTDGVVLRSSAIGSDFAWSALVALPGLLLLFWLLPRMSAARMSTRFVIAPLFTVLIGIAIDQPTITLRIWAGIVLVACGGAWLLFGRDGGSDTDPDTQSSFFNFNRD
jgi:drug/metabolite transporter (DMT)-like permease